MSTGYPAVKEIQNRPHSIQVLSDEMLRTIADWLSDCSSSHSAPAPADAKGLVELRRHGDQISANGEVQAGLTWCSLSYCWGGPQSLATRKETYSERLDDISWGHLS